jgi:hypothetical protein
MRQGRRDAIRPHLRQLSWPELLILNEKMRRAKRQASQAALGAGSLQEVWDMIRITNDLVDVADDVQRALGEVLPSWLPLAPAFPNTAPVSPPGRHRILRMTDTRAKWLGHGHAPGEAWPDPLGHWPRRRWYSWPTPSA